MAKTDKKEIGKGIRALLANIEKSEKPDVRDDQSRGQSDPAVIRIDQIEPNPFQPRIHFEPEALNELITSVKTFGIIQPITVRRLNVRKYQIISGERRWRAATQAGLESIPAFVREADDQGMLEMALLENIQRSDLNPLEIALSYQRLIDECSLTHDQLSIRLGKKRSSVSNYLRILKLPPSVQKAVQTKMITLGHAKVIASCENIEDQVLLLDAIIRDGLSVRAAETKVAKLKSGTRKTVPPAGQPHPEVLKLADRLSDLTGSKVEIKRSPTGKGVIRIPFGSDDELNGIIDSLIE